MADESDGPLTMTPLIVTVFLASVVGSLHCAGMCGAFVVFAVGSPGEARPSQAMLHIAYNGGRLIVYTALGAAAGTLGGAVDLGGSMIGAQRIAAIVAAAGVALFGVVMLLRARGVRVRLGKTPRILEKALTAGHRRAAKLSPTRRALAIGLLTPMLPCGWLYSFVLIAAGTGSPFTGAVTMAIFWMGTLPMMVALGAGARAIMGRFGAAMPTLMPLAVLVAAMGMILMRVVGPPMNHMGSMDHVERPWNAADSPNAQQAAGSEHPTQAEESTPHQPMTIDHD